MNYTAFQLAASPIRGYDNLDARTGTDHLEGDSTQVAVTWQGDDYLDGDDTLEGQDGNDQLFGCGPT